MNGIGMLNRVEYRELEIRLTTASAMVEGVYTEAKRQSGF
jgi:hypothetical protein